jgi:hypothetical protein
MSAHDIFILVLTATSFVVGFFFGQRKGIETAFIILQCVMTENEMESITERLGKLNEKK